LPPSRRAKYEASGRNSRILVKSLAPVLVPVAAMTH
jgi:hypothetical protein